MKRNVIHWYLLSFSFKLLLTWRMIFRFSVAAWTIVAIEIYCCLLNFQPLLLRLLLTLSIDLLFPGEKETPQQILLQWILKIHGPSAYWANIVVTSEIKNSESFSISSKIREYTVFSFLYFFSMAQLHVHAQNCVKLTSVIVYCIAVSRDRWKGLGRHEN